jgi:hypothetical protein
VVEEHSIGVEARSTRTCGPYGRADAGISSDKTGEKPVPRKPKVS